MSYFLFVSHPKYCTGLPGPHCRRSSPLGSTSRCNTSSPRRALLLQPLCFEKAYCQNQQVKPLCPDQRSWPESVWNSSKIRWSGSLIGYSQLQSTRCTYWLRQRVPSCLAALHPNPRPTVTLIRCHALGCQRARYMTHPDQTPQEELPYLVEEAQINPPQPPMLCLVICRGFNFLHLLDKGCSSAQEQLQEAQT